MRCLTRLNWLSCALRARPLTEIEEIEVKQMVVEIGVTEDRDKKGSGAREIEPSAATPRPAERTLDKVILDDTELKCDLQTEGEEDSAEQEDSLPVDGWLAGLPVVGGEADSGWLDCPGGRIRLVVQVKSSPEQREWIRAQVYGGAYAREVLG